MRGVDFADLIRFELAGNVNAAAIALGDVDHDQDAELVVGTIDGNLAIFKGSQPKPWRQASHLGTITAVAIGKLDPQSDDSSLVCVSAEGLCFLFNFDSISNDNSEATLRPSRQFPVPVNILRILITPNKELVVGRTDRIVHVFMIAPAGTLTELSQRAFPAQLGSFAYHGPSEMVLVSQPGGTIVPLSAVSFSYPSSEATTELCQLDHSMNGIGFCTMDGTVGWVDVVPSIITHSKPLNNIDKKQFFAIASTPLLSPSRASSDQTFAKNVLVSVAWDGTTVLYQPSSNPVLFSFPHRVCAFTAGQFAFEPGKNEPCLVYVTFHDEIFVYRNIAMSSL